MQVDTLRVTGAEDRALLGSNLSADTGAKTRLGPVQSWLQLVPPSSFLLPPSWDWPEALNPRGLGTESPGFTSSIILFVDLRSFAAPFFRRTHVSAFNFCKSLFRCWVSQSFFSLDGLEPLRAYPCVDERLGRELCGSR